MADSALQHASNVHFRVEFASTLFRMGNGVMGRYSIGVAVLTVAVLFSVQSRAADLAEGSSESVASPDSMLVAQIGIGRILGGRGLTGPTDDDDEGHKPPVTFTPNDNDHNHGHGNHGPTINFPIPIPTRPTYTPPQHYPRPHYTPRPNYTPVPNTPPQRITTSVPSNVLPTQPQEADEPITNIVPAVPKPNNFLDDLDIKRITPQQIKAFQDQITKKNQQLGEDLKKLFPGNDQAIDELINLANKGNLNAQAVERFILGLGGNLGLQVQLRATGFFKRLIFNNLAMGALLNVNVNLLGLNINIVNVNIGGGPWGGFWGFPQWPWSYPIWVGPGVWWGPCLRCAYPYYNPRLNGAWVLGIPYSVASPVPNFGGEIVSRGILLMNAGGSTVNYTIDGRRSTMEPEYQQTIPRSRVSIAFDRGGSFGHAKYGIDKGWYKFTATDRGWELFKYSAEITLDNGDNPFVFRYVLNNQQQSLQPGYRQKHSSAYPLELKFDNGQGQTTRKMLIEGDFKVAVGPSGGLELFRPEDVTTPAPIAEMSKKADESTSNIFAEPEKIPDLFGDTARSVTHSESSKSAAPATPNLFGSES